MKIAGCDLSYTSPGIVVEELDENFNVVSCEGYGFSIPKYAGGNIVEYRGKKDFPDDYARFEFLQKQILDWVKDCDYIFVEDYAINACGLVFDLAEFEGYIKQELYHQGKTLRFYSPTTNKKFYAAYGGADKISMYQTFLAFNGKKPDISKLPIVNKGDGVKPTSDIIDAHALCEMGRQELRLRRKIDNLENLPAHVQEVFALKQEKSLKKIAKKVEKGTAKRHEKVTLGITETPMIGKHLSDLDRGV